MENITLIYTQSQIYPNSEAFNILQRGIVTNLQLYKWNISETKLCFFCHQEEETVVHLLCTCTQVQQLWQKIFQYLEDFYKLQIQNRTPKALILNQLSNRRKDLSNFICLVTKQYIYSQKCQKKTIKL